MNAAQLQCPEQVSGELIISTACVSGSGGGRPTLAQAGGKDASRLPEALASVKQIVSEAL